MRRHIRIHLDFSFLEADELVKVEVAHVSVAKEFNLAKFFVANCEIFHFF